MLFSDVAQAKDAAGKTQDKASDMTGKAQDHASSMADKAGSKVCYASFLLRV